MQHHIIPQPNVIAFSGGVRPVTDDEIEILCDPSIPAEGYILDVEPDRVLLRHSTERGAFYARQTLSLLWETDGGVPLVHIEDTPRFPYRAFMLDSARHMQTVEEIKAYIDAAALFKFNTFHWHLCDDQGNRIESERFPALNEIGSFRNSHGFGSENMSRYGGYYTKAQIREIVDYCAERFIDVIPEIDMPGHVTAILAAFPHLSCREKKLDVETRAGIFKDVLCAGKEEVFDFCFAFWDEVCELFPGDTVHIGGDEAPKDRWKDCECCKDRMAREHLKDFEALQGYFMNRVAAHLQEKGKRVIAWNESLRGGNLQRDVIIADWMDKAHLSEDWANNGGKIIMEDFFHYYLDYPYGMTPLKKTYGFDPLPAALNETGKANVLGVETPLWTEFVEDFERLCLQAFPRLMAVAERGWTAEAHCNYPDFFRRAEALRGLLREKGVVMAPCGEWDPAGPGRLGKIIDHYKRTINREMLLGFVHPNKD